MTTPWCRDHLLTPDTGPVVCLNQILKSCREILLLASVLLGGLLGLIIKIRKPKQKASKIVTSYSSSGGFVDCPECSARLRPRNVEAHLLKAHGIEASSTGETES